MEDVGRASSDAELVLRTRRGQSSAFETLVRRHYRAAFVTALSLVTNSMDAEDVCQDAFVRALEKLDECRSPDKFRAWLLRIVRNRAHNYRAYQRVRTGASLEKVTPVARSNPVRDTARLELRRRLEHALEQLTETQRQVVLLHDLDGWRHQEIAVHLGMSTESSRQHLFVARRRMRQEMGTEAAKAYFDD